MTTISATGVLASRHAQQPELIGSTLPLRYPRFIHAELMTHRVFSRNAASSRAIPVKKIIDDILADTAMPLHWGANQKGMQAAQECNERLVIGTGEDALVDYSREHAWLVARSRAVEVAQAFDKAGYHKQVINRLLEPFMHITVVVTSTQWSNFLALREDSAAEPHIRILAREVRRALEQMPVQTLAPNDWHLPFATDAEDQYLSLDQRRKLSVARCASTSYKTVEGFDMTLARATELHDKLVASVPMHASPAEHQFKADRWVEDGWACPGLGGNLGPGFVQYRKMLTGECL